MLRRTLIYTTQCVLCMLLMRGIASETAPIQEVELHPSTRIRVRAFPRSATPITNPIAWAQFKSRIPEGSRVKKGDPLFELYLEPSQQRLDELQNKLLETKNESESRIKQLNRSIQTLQNRRDELQDSKQIQQARLDYLKSLPLKETVTIAEGRLKVAMENLEATRTDVSTMKARLQKGLVSKTMLADTEFENELQKARTLYARRRLASAESTPHPKEIEIVIHRIENLDREIKKLDFEIDAQTKLNTIELSSLKREFAEVQEEIREKEEELTHKAIRSPRDGVLLYTPQLKRELAKGGKPSKEMVIAEIPDPESLAFQGQLSEQLRYLYSEGDPVTIELNAYPGRELKGTLHSISPFSRDTDEQESTGVKVLDVVIVVDRPPEDIPFGIYGWATLTTKTPRSGPGIPATWVAYRAGKPHVSVNGVYQPVSGVVHQDLFQLSAPYPSLDTLMPEGEWPDDNQAELELESDRFHVSGELSPVESIRVSVPSIRSWDTKVTYLAPESELIRKGDILVTLASERILEREKSDEKEARQAEEEKNTAEKELELKKRERDFQVGSAETQLDIMRLQRDLDLMSVSASAVHQALLDVRTAEVQLEKAQRELDRLEKNPELTAPSELERKRRNIKRLSLRLEDKHLQETLARTGISEEEKSLSELKVFREEANTAKARANHFRQVARAENRLRWRIRRLRGRRQRLEKAQQDLESLTIRAPVDGLVKYEKVWDGVRRSKLKTGMRVWRGMDLVNLSNTGRVYVEIGVPEVYVNKLSLGMEVQLQIPIEGSRIWKGTVSRMGELLETREPGQVSDNLYGNREPGRHQVLPVQVVVKNSDGTQLKPGAIAHVIFPFQK